MSRDKSSTQKFGDQPPMIVPMSIHDIANTTSAFDENLVDKYPDIGMKMMLVSRKAVVSHCTCVALTSNSAMMVGKAVISRNWLNVNKNAAAITTATTPFDCTFSFVILPTPFFQ